MKKILLFLSLLIFILQTPAQAIEDPKPVLQMSDVEVFSDEDGLFGLKDKQGNVVVEPQYKKIIRLGNTSWIIQRKSKFGLMDSSGNYLIKPKYRHVERVFGEYVKLGNDKDFGLYNQKGEIVIAPEYTKIDPLFGRMFLTCKDYKYGISDETGKILLKNEYDDIYMPTPKTMRIKYDGEWFEIERLAEDEIILPEGVHKITVDNKDYKVTHLIANTGVISGYSALTLADYTLKIFSSISPAYEETIDELMLSQGAETVSIFIKLGWIPKFPFTYAKKYYNNLRAPNNGPLSDVRNDMKKQLK